MDQILVVRLGAMGDIIHALPALASLHQSFPQRSIDWVVAPRWMPLLEGNPAIHRLIAFERRTLSQLRSTLRHLRPLRPETAFDFQGLLQSAMAGRLARPVRYFGFTSSIAREPLASLFYTDRVNARGIHRVQRNLDLVKAAGANHPTEEAWLPPGTPEGDLPSQPFILASPFAGWTGKEWPLERYSELGKLLRADGLSLVLNVPASKATGLQNLANVVLHSSSLAGLIHATRQAHAIVGLDSGPLHLAAALHKPGVAIFGPTDPSATGPYADSFITLRTPEVETTYKRGHEIHGSMQAITAAEVHAALFASLQRTRPLANPHRPPADAMPVGSRP